MKVIVLDDDDSVLYMTDKEFLVATEVPGDKTRITIDCNQANCAQFVAQLMDELYNGGFGERMDETLFLQAMADLANNVVRANRVQEVQ